MMGGLLNVSWRSLWRSRRRTAITVSAIGFAVAIAVFFIAFAEGVYAQLIDQAVRMQSGHVTVQHSDYADAPAIDLAVSDVPRLRQELARLPGVETTKVLVVGQGIARTSHGTVGAAALGVEPEAEAATSVIAAKIVEGTYLDGSPRSAVVGTVLADRLRLAVGKKLVLASNDAKGDLVEELVRVQGIFATGAEEVDGYLVQVPIDFTRKLYGLRPDQATQLGLVLGDPDDQPDVLGLARQAVEGTGAAALPWQEVMPDLAAYVRIDGGSNMVFQGILIFLSLFTVFNTILMSVLERTREFAVLLALGTPPWRVKAQVVVESSLLGLLGCGAGLLVGGLLGYWMQVEGLDMKSFYDEGVTISGVALDSLVYARVTPGLLAGVGLLVFSATLLTSLVSVRQVDRIAVGDVLR